MIKKLQIFCIILFISVTKLFATSYNGLFDVKINDWYFSIQWGLDADLDYLTEKTTYYKILSLINNNYELFENLTDSLVFDISSQSDEINYYLNENEAINLNFNNKFEFIDCIYKQLLAQYNLKETSISAIDAERAEAKFVKEESTSGNAGYKTSEKQNNESEKQEVEKNPSIFNLHWEDENGKTITKALVGDEVYLCADVKDIDDGKNAKIKIVEKDDDGNDDEVTTLTAKVQNGKIRTKWKVLYTEDNDDSNSQQEKEEKGYTLPEYVFTVECDSVESDESGQLDVMGWIKTQIIDRRSKEPVPNRNYTIYKTDGSTITGKTDKEGYVYIKDLKIGGYRILIRGAYNE